MQRAFAVSLLLVLLALFCYMISGFFGALVLAGGAALMFHPLQYRLERHVSPAVAASLNLALLIVLVVVPVFLLLGLATGQALNFAEAASGWIGNHLNDGSTLIGVELPEWLGEYQGDVNTIRDELISKLGELVGTVGRFVAGTLTQVTQATAVLLLDAFVAAYFFFYCLLSGGELAQSIVASLPLRQGDREEFLRVGANVTRSVLKSMVVIGAVQGFFAGLGFYIVGVGGVVLWGIVMGFLSVIPFIGPVIIWLPVAVYLAVQGEYWSALFLAGWFWLVVASVDNVLRPWLVGTDTQMPDVLVLLTTLGGLFMFGAIGLLVGPLVGAMLMASWAVYRRVFADELAPAGRATDGHQGDTAHADDSDADREAGNG
jgi:predicted PurR-regulated permease PerM